MNINGIKCLDYNVQNGVLISMIFTETDFDTVLNLNTEDIVVMTDTGDIVEVFSHYTTSSVRFIKDSLSYEVVVNKFSDYELKMIRMESALASLQQKNDALEDIVVEMASVIYA